MYLITREQFSQLTRDEMYKTLLSASPDLAKGKSRAKKEELTALYDSLRAAHDTFEVPFPPSTEEMKFVGGVGPEDVRILPDSTTALLPQLADVEKMVPVNPPAPAFAMNDGEVINLPPDPADRKFTFRDGIDKPLTPKQIDLLTRADKVFERFCENPQDRSLKKDFESLAFSLKTTGILLNPKYFETLKAGRAHVRDFRRKLRAGVDISAAAEGSVEKTASA